MTADRLGTIDRLRELAAQLDQPRTLSMFAGPNDMVIALMVERVAIASALAETIAALTPAAGGSWVYGVSSPATGGKPYIAEAGSTARFYIEDQFGDALVRHEYLKTLVARLNATPPPADAVRALVGKWRDDAKGANVGRSDYMVSLTLSNCATALEAALSAAPAGEERCPTCDGTGYYAGRAEYGPCDCALPKPAAAPTPEGRKDCGCGCNDPCFTEPLEALQFLSDRMKHAGISEAVGAFYARDIDAILARLTQQEPPHDR